MKTAGDASLENMLLWVNFAIRKRVAALLLCLDLRKVRRLLVGKSSWQFRRFIGDSVGVNVQSVFTPSCSPSCLVL